ncbi:MAG: response regulator transcription factor [Candidatus Saccharibacteria bacterium]|nr:response regulator transcription factor [Rhodoferax sp.]
MTSSPLPALRALIADDERLLREQLQSRLKQVWPELVIVGMARDGLEVVRMADELRPDILFLDIRMPGQTGIEAASDIMGLDGWKGELVFVTAYDEYAVSAFERGAIDYLLKPVEAERLQSTRARIEARLKGQVNDKNSASTGLAATEAAAQAATDRIMQTLLSVQRQLSGAPTTPKMRWIQASTGSTTRLIAVEDILFFRSDEKYTRVQTAEQEALIRVPIKDLLPQLDEQVFWQIHRSTIVNVGEISAVHRDDTGRQRVAMKRHPETLEVSRTFAHLFRNQ